MRKSELDEVGNVLAGAVRCVKAHLTESLTVRGTPVQRSTEKRAEWNVARGEGPECGGTWQSCCSNCILKPGSSL